jgi:hypothetical protein
MENTNDEDRVKMHQESIGQFADIMNAAHPDHEQRNLKRFNCQLRIHKQHDDNFFGCLDGSND